MYGEAAPTPHGAMLGIAIAQLIVFSILGIFLAIGNYFLAKRLAKSRTAWIIFSLIPGVNFIFMYYVFYQVLYGILDRLPARPVSTME